MGNGKQKLVALLIATAREDRRAFAEFYARTSSRVYGMICDVTAESKHSDDVMQDAFVLAWQRAGQYDPATEDPMTWIMTLAHRHAVDQARKETTLLPPGSEGMQRTPATRAETGSIDALHPTERESIMMSYGAGMTYQKVAEKLGVTEGIIKGRIREGMRSLNHNHTEGPQDED